MRYMLFFQRIIPHAPVAGLACSLWLCATVDLAAAILGGTLAHRQTALSALLAGLAAGLLLARRPPPLPSRLAALALGALPLAGLARLLEPAAGIHPLAALFLLAALAVPVGMLAGSRSAFTALSSPSALIGLAGGALLAGLVIHLSGPFPPLLAGLFSLHLLVPPPGLEASPPAGSAGPEELSPAEILSRASLLVLAALMGALAALLPRPLALAWPLPLETPSSWLTLFAPVAAATAWLTGRSRRPQDPLSPWSLAVPALALLATLLLAAPLQTGLPAPTPDRPASLTSLLFPLALTALVFGPLLHPLFSSRRPDHRPLALLIGALSALLTVSYAIPALSTVDLVRLIALLLLLWAGALTLLPLRRIEVRTFSRLAAGGFLLAASALPLFIPGWEPARLALPQGLPLEGSSPTASVRYQGEDAHGVVVVTGRDAAQALTVQRDPLFVPADAGAEAFAGALPALLHAAPRRGLLAGTGAGLALDAARAFGVQTLTLLNPSPLRAGVLELFSPLNRQVLVDPRVQVALEALRPFSRNSGTRFDTITLLAPAPGSLEARGLYSREGLSRVRELLEPGGVAVIELPLSVDPTWFQAALASFRQVFPGGLLFLSPDTDRRLLLAGSTAPLRISYTRLEAALAAARNRPAPLRSLDSSAVLAQLLLVSEGLESLSGTPLRDLFPGPARPAAAAISPLPTLLPALRPLTAAVRDLPDGPAAAVITADLDRVLARHRSYLSLLGNLEQGTYTDVIREARKMLELAPRSGVELEGFTRPYLNRAERFREEGRLEKAVEQLSVVRLIHPALADAPYQLGRIFEQKGDRTRAIDHYREALRLSPDLEPAALGLANLLREDGRLKEAVELLEATLTRRPGSAVVHHNLGSLHLSLNQLTRARERFDQAIRLNSGLAEPHAGLAEVFFRQARYDAAIQEAEIAARLKPSAYTLNLVGQIALRRGDRPRARSAFVQCLLKDPDHLEARGGMGILYAESGEYGKAREAWERVLQLDPENQAAKQNLELLNQQFPPIVPGGRRP